MDDILVNDCRPIVAGLDGSISSERALEWAARNSQLTGAPLHVVYVKEPASKLGAHARFDALPALADEHDPGRRQVLLRDYVAHVLPIADLPPLTLIAIEGHAADVLTEYCRAQNALLLVVGRRGVSGFTRLLLGSTSEECLRSSDCPVAVISGVSVSPNRPMVAVAGVDGSDASEQAALWAASLVARTGGQLEVAAAWEAPEVPSASIAGTFLFTQPDGEAYAAEARAACRSIRTRLAHAFPAIKVSYHVEHGPAQEVLRTLALDADATMLVLGSRGRGAVAGSLLGSVGRDCIASARCPVVILPAGSQAAAGTAEAMTSASA